MDYLVLVFALLICFILMWILFILIGSNKHGATIFSLGSVITIAVVAVFGISIPKISNLFLKNGGSVLKISQLNDEIKKLKDEYGIFSDNEHPPRMAASLNSSGIGANASIQGKKESKDFHDLIAKVKKDNEKKGFDDGVIILQSKMVDSKLLPKNLSSKEWLIFSQKNPQESYQQLYGADSKFQDLGEAKLSSEQYDMLVNKIQGANLKKK